MHSFEPVAILGRESLVFYGLAKAVFVACPAGGWLTIYILRSRRERCPRAEQQDSDYRKWTGTLRGHGVFLVKRIGATIAYGVTN
jgi:hypothetical protein